MNNIYYIKFVISKVESGFLGFSNSREFVKVITILHSLKMADNILKELYILSGIKKLRRLTGYFIFMIKKIEAGSITLDNFMENYITDKNYIDAYFLTYYDLEQITSEEFNNEEIDTKFIIDEEEVDEVPVYSLAETTFKVEDLDNALVKEEFRESSLNENYEQPIGDYLRLAEEFDDNSLENTASKDNFFDDGGQDVFTLPKKEQKINNNVLSKKIGNDSDSVTDDPLFIEEYKLTENTIETQRVLFGDGDESEEVNSEDFVGNFEKLNNQSTSGADPEDNIDFIETTLNGAEEQTNIHKDIIPDAGNTHEVESKVPQELIPMLPDVKKSGIGPEEIKTDINKDVEEKLQKIAEETSEEILNSEFLRYEKYLFEKNKLIIGLLNDLVLISDSKEPDVIMKDAILNEIFPLVENLKTESKKMSFEIISGIYDSLMFCLDIKFKDIVVSNENIVVFKLSIAGVENLVRGDELKDFDKTIKNLENIQCELNKLLADREDFQKKKYDFGEEENNLIKEFKDSSEYDAYIILRDKITYLEDTFQVIAGIKDKTYPFESLRKLSVTFALFREIVNIARVLEMNRVAQLAEAGYVFVKFVQNYRIDPFKEEVTEVFKYLIYSFKLIYLDKPVKDFDMFVSFLNDPVKIFYSKKTNK